MKALFPADNLDSCYRGRITTLLASTGEQDEVSRLAIGYCHWAGTGKHAPWTGFRAVLQELQVTSAAGGLLRPTLIFGFHSRDRVRGQPDAAVLEWPGADYLRYDATDAELLATVQRIIEGAKAPMPVGLLPTVKDILRAASEVRHWLENRLRNTQGTLVDFQNAARGSMQLHEAHLERTVPISQAHRQMLDRLWALEAAAERFAPQSGGFAPMKAAIAEFETQWHELEAVRAQLRSRGGTVCAKLLGKAVQGLECACSALDAAIKLTNSVGREMTAEGGG